MDIRKALPPALMLIVGLALAGVVWAQVGGGYDLTWWTVNGGGGTVSGGGYTLVGTAGQPEPGPALTGGGFTLYSGFWPAEGAEPPVCEQVTAVAINGDTSGPPGDYTFTSVITPPSATQPITYLWDNGDTTASSTRNLTTGTHTLTVTATNCSGAGKATDDHVVVISALQPGCPVPLTGVTISGPASGHPNTAYSFSASVSPPDATTPITYTWLPAPDSGQGSVSVEYTWTTTGTKTIAVNAQNCGRTRTDTHKIDLTARHRIYLPAVLRNK